MKKIIDANYFQDPALTDYLRSDKRNFVVFSDYACMEAYKGNAIKNISKSIEIVSQFPDQVIVLKGTRDIVKLSLLPDGLNKFEDPIQTREFKIFCLGVSRAVQGDLALASQVLQKGQLATEHFNKILKDTEAIAKGIKELTKSFKHDHLRALRKKEKLEPEVINRIIRDILLTAGFLFRDHPDVDERPQASQLPNSYILRYAVSAYLLALQWISDGGPGTVKRKKLRNDYVDMLYVAYATFYDGLLTRDAKMKGIYEETCFVLKNVF
ncbi:MAG: hypothetical protein L6247_00880 [Desulfobacteraceae bacterium]|nr:hypothetical protein [Pseudomonadota bacterium]MBU4463254.1 hypothetical protein [Pseudomonadota bacterium]MCG2754121.1 hypothetical protein [Desulfobacteraceae bacterium]